MADSKYGDCVVTLPIHKMRENELMHVDARNLNGFNCSIIYAFAFKTGITGLSTKPHVHNYDEAIFFIEKICSQNITYQPRKHGMIF